VGTRNSVATSIVAQPQHSTTTETSRLSPPLQVYLAGVQCFRVDQPASRVGGIPVKQKVCRSGSPRGWQCQYCTLSPIRRKKCGGRNHDICLAVKPMYRVPISDILYLHASVVLSLLAGTRRLSRTASCSATISVNVVIGCSLMP
jgi:hypothetical protein